MNPKISIIVPVYKVEPYLKKCIDSILNQTFKDFELILVDDGSPDKCGDICDEYAKKDNRIKVIHKQNGGLSSARNAGLDIAKGDYIGFIDSDDWIESDMYEVLYNLCINNEADIASCEVLNLYEKKDIQKKNNDKIVKIYKGKNKILDAHYNREFNFSSCTKLIKRKKLNNLRFKNGMISEDVIFMIKLYNQIEKLVYISEQKYIYFHRRDSITTSLVSIKRLDNLYHSIDLYNYLDNRYKNQVVKGAQEYAYNLAIEIINEKTILKNRQLLKKIKEIFNKNKFLLKEIDIKIKLLLIFPLVYCTSYRIGKEIKKVKNGGYIL